MAAQQIEFRALYEQLLINKQELQIKFEKVVTRETDLRQNLALRDAEYEEAKIIIKKTQDELIAVKNALENHQSIYEEEKMIMNKKFEALQSERNQLLVQNQVYSDQAYKISSNVNQKQRIIDKLQDQLTQLNYQLAKANQQPVVEYRVPTPIQTVDFQCQVTNSIKLLDKEKFYEVLLDQNTPIDEVLECIDAEMSQTSQEFSFNDNMKDITERDNYDMLLKKIQAKFVSKLQFEQMKALNQQMKQKYIKYKQKYTSINYEVELQILVSEFRSLDDTIKEIEDMIAKPTINMTQALQDEFKQLRNGLEQKLQKVNEDIQFQTKLVNIKDLKIEKQLVRVSGKYQFDDKIQESTTRLSSLLPQATNLKTLASKNKNVKIRKNESKVDLKNQDTKSKTFATSQLKTAFQTQIDVQDIRNTKTTQAGDSVPLVEEYVQVDVVQEDLNRNGDMMEFAQTQTDFITFNEGEQAVPEVQIGNDVDCMTDTIQLNSEIGCQCSIITEDMQDKRIFDLQPINLEQYVEKKSSLGSTKQLNKNSSISRRSSVANASMSSQTRKQSKIIAPKLDLVDEASPRQSGVKPALLEYTMQVDTNKSNDLMNMFNNLLDKEPLQVVQPIQYVDVSMNTDQLQEIIVEPIVQTKQRIITRDQGTQHIIYTDDEEQQCSNESQTEIQTIIQQTIVQQDTSNNVNQNIIVDVKPKITFCNRGTQHQDQIQNNTESYMQTDQLSRTSFGLQTNSRVSSQPQQIPNQPTSQTVSTRYIKADDIQEIIRSKQNKIDLTIKNDLGQQPNIVQNVTDITNSTQQSVFGKDTQIPVNITSTNILPPQSNSQSSKRQSSLSVQQNNQAQQQQLHNENNTTEQKVIVEQQEMLEPLTQIEQSTKQYQQQYKNDQFKYGSSTSVKLSEQQRQQSEQQQVINQLPQGQQITQPQGFQVLKTLGDQIQVLTELPKTPRNNKVAVQLVEASVQTLTVQQLSKQIQTLNQDQILQYQLDMNQKLKQQLAEVDQNYQALTSKNKDQGHFSYSIVNKEVQCNTYVPQIIKVVEEKKMTHKQCQTSLTQDILDQLLAQLQQLKSELTILRYNKKEHLRELAPTQIKTFNKPTKEERHKKQTTTQPIKITEQNNKRKEKVELLTYLENDDKKQQKSEIKQQKQETRQTEPQNVFSTQNNDDLPENALEMYMADNEKRSTIDIAQQQKVSVFEEIRKHTYSSNTRSSKLKQSEISNQNLDLQVSNLQTTVNAESQDYLHPLLNNNDQNKSREILQASFEHQIVKTNNQPTVNPIKSNLTKITENKIQNQSREINQILIQMQEAKQLLKEALQDQISDEQTSEESSESEVEIKRNNTNLDIKQSHSIEAHKVLFEKLLKMSNELSKLQQQKIITKQKQALAKRKQQLKEQQQKEKDLQVSMEQLLANVTMPVKTSISKPIVIKSNTRNIHISKYQDIFTEVIGEMDDKPKIKEYDFVNGKFISPYSEALYQREIRKQLKRKEKSRNVAKRVLKELNGLQIKTQQLQFEDAFDIQKSNNDLMFYYMPNLFEDQPRIISSVEYDNFQKAKLVKRVDRFKLGFFLPKATLKNVQDGDKATNVKIGQQVTYAEILLDSKFKKMFEELGFNVVVSQTTMFVKTAANTSLKPVTWLLRTMRLFYYELGQAKSSFTKLFLTWAKQKFANQLMLQKFLSVFYSNLVFHMQQDNIPSASAEIKMFYFLFESDADVDQILEFVNVRNYFKLEKQSPNTQTYEDMLKETVEADPAAFVQQFVSQPKHQKIFTKYLQAKKATQHEFVHILLNIENQTRLKQTNQFIKAFNATGKQGLTCDEVIEILKKFYLFLSTPTLENIVAQYGLETFKLEPFLVIVKNLMSMKPQSDDLLVSAEKKYKICEQICQKLIDDGLMEQLDKEKIDVLNENCKFHIGNRNSIQASWNVSCLYKELCKIQSLTKE
ncbi:Conserved_hypothetical protein [Hexamita inflata]|uniref:Vitellogenin domain-containing protein n=1 Tax=Hexamita inflata TaxID=28002 RepID=A0AA86TIA1_9EUKA|nr:Conserved hypothetical protein [Hexamita inflata]